ncbi:MAG: transposase [Lachnospiraceae bacterium]|nr:transposase [Lachnospiraceae bacterium]
MIQYYILQDKANDHAGIWYDGSIAQLLFPKANMAPQRISDFLKSIGRRETVEQFFEAHIKWVKENVCNDPAILIDSTGMPNNIHFPLTAISNHNGRISREARMTTIIQRDTGYPLMFRITPGNINDISTITRSISDLGVHDIDTDFVLMDAEYFTEDNVDALYTAGIDFITRLPERNRILYNTILSEGQDKLIKRENLVRYNNRAVYIVRLDCRLGKQKQEGFAYLGHDVDRASDEVHKAVKRLAHKKLSDEQFQKTLDNAGLFVIVSSLPYQSDEILPVYYIRQAIEQYFDISKGSSKLTPSRIHSEEALYGHLTLSMIAATINIRIMNTIKQYHNDRDSLFMSLNNQKCLVYRTQINTCEPQAMAKEFYNKFHIKCPLCLKRTSSGLSPQYELSRHDEYQV